MSAITLTIFPDVHASSAREESIPWPEFVDRLRDRPPAQQKLGQLVKLATFGTKRTDKGSLRHDGNVIGITGLEGDYDGEEIPPIEAVERLERHHLRAVVVTTWSHTPERPRWRVFAPLSREVVPEDRDRLIAGLNGALGGILNGESFALSQSYFVGRKADAEYLVVETFGDPDEGICIDEWPELSEFAIGKPSSNGTRPRVQGAATGAAEVSEHLCSALESNVRLRALWTAGKDGGTDRSRNDAALAWALGAHGFGDVDVEAAIRNYPLGQVGQAALEGQDADRQIGRLLGIAAKARDEAFRAEQAQRQVDELTLTDTGNSTRLVQLHGDRLRYVAKWDKWITWDGSRWQIDDGAVRVRELAKDVGAQIKREAAELEGDVAKRMFKFGLDSLSSGRIGSMVNLARGIDGVLLDHSKLDTDPYLLGVLNGVVDLRTGQLRDADPADLMTMQAPAKYDPRAEAPRFRQALEEWFPDPDVRTYVQRVVGAALVGEQRDHVLVIFYGVGANGKSTFIRAIRSALGAYCVVIHLSLIEQTKFREHDTERAHLFRARIAIASETERRIKLAEASVKNLTGGDPIHARRLYEDPWEFIPSHSLWLQTNHLPKIAGRDAGIWRRIRVVKWVSTFDRNRQDRGLDEKLRAEAPGILRWAVEGCLAWQRDGLAEPEAVIRDTLEYRSAEDTFGRFAAEVGLTFEDPEASIEAGELQRILTEWAESEGLKPYANDFGDWLRDHGATKKFGPRIRTEDNKMRRPKVWVGVKVAPPDTSVQESFLTRARKEGLYAERVPGVPGGDADEYDRAEREAIQAEQDLTSVPELPL